jgi:hypothetical protein
MHACRRQYPGRYDESCSLLLFHHQRPSPNNWRVSTCVTRFEACSTFTRVTTYMLTEPLKRPFTSKAPTTSLPPSPLRLLPGGTNQFPGGTYPTGKHRLSQRTIVEGLLVSLMLAQRGKATRQGYSFASTQTQASPLRPARSIQRATRLPLRASAHSFSPTLAPRPVALSLYLPLS